MKINYPTAFFTVLTCLTLLVAGSEVSAQSTSSPHPKVLEAQMRLDALRANKERLLSDLSELQQQADELFSERVEIIREQDANGISLESFPEIVKSLQSNRIDLLIDIAGLDARREFLTQTKLDAQAEARAAILEPIKELLMVEEQSFERVRQLFERGSVSEAQVAEAERSVLQAKIRLAEASSRMDSGKLNDDLLVTSLERAEKQARLDKTMELLDSLEISRNAMQFREEIEIKIESSQRKISRLNGVRSDLEGEIRKSEENLEQLRVRLK